MLLEGHVKEKIHIFTTFFFKRLTQGGKTKAALADVSRPLCRSVALKSFHLGRSHRHGDTRVLRDLPADLPLPPLPAAAATRRLEPLVISVR